MANNCFYDMRVKGTKENVEAFVKMMKMKYNADTTKEKHFWRVFSADEIDEYEADGDYVKNISGDCAWSVRTTMTEDGYAKDWIAKYPEQCTSLKEQSALKQLEIEVYSEEPGMAFMEHYHYKNGEALTEDCTDWSCYYVTTQEELDDYNEQHKTEWTMKDLEDGSATGYNPDLLSFVDGGYDYNFSF